MRILLTNDDSHRSPLFRLTIELLRHFGDLSIVVPHHEQSWTSKSMTRFGEVSVHEIELFGHAAFAVTGTPADCVNLGIHNLFDSKPDIIVSGINAGLNCGIAFLLSSGTVGAAIEGNLSGIPALALSQAFDSTTFNRYIADYSIDSESVARFEAQYARAVRPIVEIVVGNLLPSLSRCAATINVNMPHMLKEDWSIALTDVDHTTYGSVFEPRADFSPGSSDSRIFRHSVKNVVKEGIEHGDIATISRGDVSLTPLNPWMLGRAKNSELTEWTSFLVELHAAIAAVR